MKYISFFNFLFVLLFFNSCHKVEILDDNISCESLNDQLYDSDDIQDLKIGQFIRHSGYNNIFCSNYFYLRIHSTFQFSNTFILTANENTMNTNNIYLEYKNVSGDLYYAINNQVVNIDTTGFSNTGIVELTFCDLQFSQKYSNSIRKISSKFRLKINETPVCYETLATNLFIFGGDYIVLNFDNYVSNSDPYIFLGSASQNLKVYFKNYLKKGNAVYTIYNSEPIQNSDQLYIVYTVGSQTYVAQTGEVALINNSQNSYDLVFCNVVFKNNITNENKVASGNLRYYYY